MAEVLLEGDLLGHTTHGLDMLAAYLKDLDAGRMAKAGEPETLSDSGAALVWDGRYLPGPWLVKRAIATATERLASHPVAVVVIRRSHHIGCLQAYLKPVTDEGRVIVLTCSDPSGAGVTPHGGVASRITPNPLAAGFPTGGDPVLMDISMSTTTNAMTKRQHEAGERLPGPWLVDADGRASDDPAVLFADPPGAVLPLGGLDLGHKGFALALLVEALTSGLAGHGRADEPKNWGASVFLMLIDPDALRRRATRSSARRRGWPTSAARPPSRRAPRRYACPAPPHWPAALAELAEGVELHPTVLNKLAPWAEKWSVSLPSML